MYFVELNQTGLGTLTAASVSVDTGHDDAFSALLFARNPRHLQSSRHLIRSTHLMHGIGMGLSFRRLVIREYLANNNESMLLRG